MKRDNQNHENQICEVIFSLVYFSIVDVLMLLIHAKGNTLHEMSGEKIKNERLTSDHLNLHSISIATSRDSIYKNLILRLSCEKKEKQLPICIVESLA